MPVRRGRYAILGSDERVQLRAMLLDRIAADPEFAMALRALFETHVPWLAELPRWPEFAWQVPLDDARGDRRPEDEPAPGVAAYVAAVRALAKRWGLDRLIAEREELGARLIHDWCRSRRRIGPEVSVAWLVHGLTEAHYVPEIGEVVARSETDLGDMLVVDQLVRPVVRVVVIDEWDPQRESRASARRRLRALADTTIQDELDRLTADAESKGYRFVDRAPALDRDLNRLFQLMAKGATLADLAAETEAYTLKPEAAVRRSIYRIARRTGVSVRGWELPRG
jgi:hypothetical protein